MADPTCPSGWIQCCSGWNNIGAGCAAPGVGGYRADQIGSSIVLKDMQSADCAQLCLLTDGCTNYDFNDGSLQPEALGCHLYPNRNCTEPLEYPGSVFCVLEGEKPTLPPNKMPYQVEQGQLCGNDINTLYVTIEYAKSYCSGLIGCKGFYFHDLDTSSKSVVGKSAARKAAKDEAGASEPQDVPTCPDGWDAIDGGCATDSGQYRSDQILQARNPSTSSACASQCMVTNGCVNYDYNSGNLQPEALGCHLFPEPKSTVSLYYAGSVCCVKQGSGGNPPGYCGSDVSGWGLASFGKIAGCSGCSNQEGDCIGCNVGGVDECAYCVFDMDKCTAQFGQDWCDKVNTARSNQGLHCDKQPAQGQKVEVHFQSSWTPCPGIASNSNADNDYTRYRAYYTLQLGKAFGTTTKTDSLTVGTAMDNCFKDWQNCDSFYYSMDHTVSQKDMAPPNAVQVTFLSALGGFNQSDTFTFTYQSEPDIYKRGWSTRSKDSAVVV